MSVAWKFIIWLLKISYAFKPSEMLPHKTGHRKKQNKCLVIFNSSVRRAAIDVSYCLTNFFTRREGKV